ncbi:MAG: cation:proton antiporter, partial [Gammaproteobacteria bacterium]
LQTLAEKKQLTTRHGRAAFAILLFQDLAVIPVLALMPLLASDGAQSSAGTAALGALKAAALIALVVVVGRFVLKHILRVVAKTGIHEVSTATALLVVLGTAVLMQFAGLSMALGAFLAGVLLADSEYRHALEADIEPFKGLLLGLFFISVGISVNLDVLASRPLTVLGIVAGLMSAKFAVLYGLGKAQAMTGTSAGSLGIAISQGGEFAFVILGAAAGLRLVEPDLQDLLIVAVTVSMAVTPLLFVLDEKLVQPWLDRAQEPDYETPPDEDNAVLIAGFGRFGQVVGRILRAKRIPYTALDISAQHVDFVARFGTKIYYGDASRLDLLRAAGAGKARIFVLAIDDVESSVRTAEVVRGYFPNLTVYARARNRKHAYRLMDLEVKIIRRETLLSSLDLARSVLMGLGLSKHDAESAVATFSAHDEKRLIDDHAMHNDDERMVYLAKESAKELEEIFAEDERARAE